MPALVTTGGAVLWPWGPTQTTPAGYNTGLAASSVPLAQWPTSPGGTINGRVVSYRQLYARQPWVFVVVNKISRQIARLPLKTYEIDSQGQRRRVRSGPLHDLITAPTGPRGRAAAIDLKMWLLQPALIHGNSLLRKVRAAGPGSPPTRLESVAWESVEITDSGWSVTDPRTARRSMLDWGEALHIAWASETGGVGSSPLQALGTTLRIEDSAQQHQEGVLRNGARIPGVFELGTDFLGIPREDRQQALSDFRADVTRLHAGASNAGRPPILPVGVKYSPTAFSAVEAELVEQRRITREEVAAVYEIPPPLIGILDHATYSNVSEMHRMLFTTVLGPWITLIEETMMAQLVRNEPAFEGQFIEFDLAEVLRGDLLQELQALNLAVRGGFMTINEARAVRNLAAIPDPACDQPLIPANNSIPVDRLDEFISGTLHASEPLATT